MKKSNIFNSLCLSTLAGALAACTPQPPQTEKPVALLATGTNGGTDVRSETVTLIQRLQNAGYRVVVIPPRKAPAAATADRRNLLPRHAAVTAAAQERGAEILTPQSWAPDGFHISDAEALAIGRKYKGAPTFGDSNSVAVNRGTGGSCMGVSGMKTHEMLLTQFPPNPLAGQQPCRHLRDLQRRIAAGRTL